MLYFMRDLRNLLYCRMMRQGSILKSHFGKGKTQLVLIFLIINGLKLFFGHFEFR